MKHFKEILEKLKAMDKNQWIVVILTGVLLLVVAIPLERPKEAKEGEGTSDAAQDENVSEQNSDYQRRMEQQLQKILSQVEGVGEVEVMITLKDRGEQILAKDTAISNRSLSQQDGAISSESTHEATTVYDGAEEPVATKSVMPDIEGVMVVAQGAGNSVVENRIYQSVMALFPVDAHKISVVKMKGREEP